MRGPNYRTCRYFELNDLHRPYQNNNSSITSRSSSSSSGKYDSNIVLVLVPNMIRSCFLFIKIRILVLVGDTQNWQILARSCDREKH